MPHVTIIGNLVADPELRFTPKGDAVANFTVCHTERVYDRDTNQWTDGAKLFLRASVWRDAAERATEELTKGQRVIVVGKLRQREFETREGEKRSVVELEAEEIGPSLKFAAKGSKPAKASKPAEDPWGTTSEWGQPSDQPPF